MRKRLSRAIIAVLLSSIPAQSVSAAGWVDDWLTQKTDRLPATCRARNAGTILAAISRRDGKAQTATRSPSRLHGSRAVAGASMCSWVGSASWTPLTLSTNSRPSSPAPRPWPLILLSRPCASSAPTPSKTWRPLRTSSTPCSLTSALPAKSWSGLWPTTTDSDLLRRCGRNLAKHQGEQAPQRCQYLME